jgi:hypothetical protein
MRRRRHRRRRHNFWKDHAGLHRRAARKGWARHRRRYSHRRKHRVHGKRYIRFRGHRVSWKGLVKKLGVMGAKRRWHKARKIGGRRR